MCNTLYLTTVCAETKTLARAWWITSGTFGAVLEASAVETLEHLQEGFGV